MELPENCFQITVSKRVRAAKLKIDPASNQPLILVLPTRGMNEKEALNFVRNNEGWIKRHLDKLPSRVRLTAQSSIEILGEKVSLVSEGSSKAAPSGLVLTFAKGATEEEKSRTIMKNLDQSLEKLVAEHKPLMLARLGWGTRALPEIKVSRRMRNWGLCRRINSDDFRISLNVRLALAPKNIALYVYAHEVAHMKELNHSQRFWDLVEIIWPSFEYDRKWLRKNGAELQAFQI